MWQSDHKIRCSGGAESLLRVQQSDSLWQFVVVLILNNFLYRNHNLVKRHNNLHVHHNLIVVQGSPICCNYRSGILLIHLEKLPSSANWNMTRPISFLQEERGGSFRQGFVGMETRSCCKIANNKSCQRNWPGC